MYSSFIGLPGVVRIIDLSDVSHSPGSGNLLRWDGSEYASAKINVDTDISSVDDAAKAADTVLVWDGGNYVYADYISTVTDLTDVTGTPALDYVLIHDGAEWVAQPEPYLRDLIDDTTPELGGDFDGGGFDMTGMYLIQPTNYLGVDAWSGTGWGTSSVGRRIFGTGDPGTMSGAPASSWLECSFAFYGSHCSIVPDSGNSFPAGLNLRSNFGMLQEGASTRLASHGGTLPNRNALFFVDQWLPPGDTEPGYSSARDDPFLLYNRGDGLGERKLMLGDYEYTTSCLDDQCGGTYTWAHHADKISDATTKAWAEETQMKIGRLMAILNKYGYIVDDVPYQGASGTTASGTVTLASTNNDGIAYESGSFNNAGTSLSFRSYTQGSNAAGFTSDDAFIFLSFVDPDSSDYVKNVHVEFTRWVNANTHPNFGVVEIRGVNDSARFGAALANNSEVISSTKTDACVYWMPHADGQAGSATLGKITTPNLAAIVDEIRNNGSFTKGTSWIHLIFRVRHDLCRDSENNYLQVYAEDYTTGGWTSIDWEYVT